MRACIFDVDIHWSLFVEIVEIWKFLNKSSERAFSTKQNLDFWPVIILAAEEAFPIFFLHLFLVYSLFYSKIERICTRAPHGIVNEKKLSPAESESVATDMHDVIRLYQQLVVIINIY